MFRDSRITGVVIVTLMALMMALIKPFAGLAPLGHYVIASVMITLGLWIFKPGGVPFLAGSAFLVAGCLVLGLKYSVVASGFVSPAVWILIPALYFGFVLQKTGLGKRIAYSVLKSFTPSWATMALSWFIIGMALSALTPSITVRLAIVMPIALGIIDACKQEHKSKGSAYIALIAFAMCIFPGTGWLTGSLSGPIMIGFLPPALKPLATFDNWFKMLALPWFVVTVVYIILVYLLMKPKEDIGIPRDTFKKQYAELGPVTRQEIITALILLGSLVLFTTEKIHGIPAAATALLALFLLLLFGIIEAEEIGTGANWDIIVFFGVTIGLSTIFMEAGVSAWIAPLLEPAMLSLAPNPLLFMMVATFGILLIRFIDVPWGYSAIALTTTVLIPVWNQFGIHPLVATFAYLAGINFFLLGYQQPWILMAEGIIRNKGWAAGHILTAGLCYIIAVVVALLVSVPYWRMIGAIH
ncbi:MAG: anion permease [Deltaproteobacteria bacterium]|nr:anion permease [Deltaproteobacteria bacterium]